MDNWVFELLSFWRVFPRVMFSGRQSVLDLDLFLFAYKSARIASGLYLRNEDEILRKFSVWLCDVRFNCPRANWRFVVQRHDPSETSVTTFFDLFDEFRQSVNIEWIPLEEIPDRWHWHITLGAHSDWCDFDDTV